ncbi:M28 family peptidase [candidate division KSB1 bacterium]|nr:M28 family peptidase [candidate division KSB1 bacterium]
MCKEKILIDKTLVSLCESYMYKLCKEISERCVGSEGNRQATHFFAEELDALGWHTESHEFDAMDWQDGGASITAVGRSFQAFAGPYSLACEANAELVAISNIDELKKADIGDKNVLLHGDIAKEQLMPKNFVFYNPEEHQEIISLLEKGKPNAIISATSRNAALAGGVYPFPLIEDGDFDIPSVYMTEEEGEKLLSYVGQSVQVNSLSRRIPAKGYNVVAKKGRNPNERIVITAHIDSKKGTPGAIDNGTGVAILLLLAKLLSGYNGKRMLEIVAFNGEDYYAVPGQMLYLAQNQNHFDDIFLNINIDGAGYKHGNSAFSFFGLPEHVQKIAEELPRKFEGIVEGVQWVQGDHSIFIQGRRPAIAVSSEWFIENIDSQDITHTPKDKLDIVDCEKLVDISKALQYFIEKINT